LKDDLEAARRAQAMAVGQAKLDAEKKVQELEKTLKQETKAVEGALTSKITEVKEQTAAVNSKVGEVSTEVGAVKTEVASTKTELEKTIGDLKRVRGDLGEQSGLVATNGKELQALKALGERNYFEFRLPKAKQPQKVGDVLLTLKKSDLKKNRFTIELIADDKKVEKKDKSINEPLQFYTSKARQPYEIVINEVGKDLIVGYLATPKVQNARN
jgi:chromosome segregation ATPase